jgi:hypothetical protein
MLVLIVVTAATLFAAFVASYEKQLTAQEAQTHNRNLESLRVLSVSPTLATAVSAGSGTSTTSVPAGTSWFSTAASSSGVTSVTGTDFGMTDQVTVMFDGAALSPVSCGSNATFSGSMITLTTGAFTCTVPIPTGIVGSTPFAVADSTTAVDAIPLFNIMASASATAVTTGSGTSAPTGTSTLSTLASNSGATLATGTGFGTGDAVTIAFAGTALTPISCTSGMTAGTVITATSTGGFACLVPIPTGYIGTESFTATDTTVANNDLTYPVTASQTTNTIGELGLTLASLSINPSSVTQILVNDAPLVAYSVTGDIVGSLNLTQGAPYQFTIGAEGEVTIVAYPGLNPDVFLYLNTFIKVQFLTVLTNEFTQVFVPPVAVAQVGTIQSYGGSPPGPETLPLLDGSKSFPSGNATLVSWSWGVVGSGSCAGPYSGQEVALSGSCAHSPPVSYAATLTITDSNGLIATAAVSFSY